MPRYLLLEPIRYQGRVRRPEPGQDVTLEIPPEVAAPLLECGAVCAADGGGAEISVEEVVAAISDLVAAVQAREISEADALTRAGKPSATVLSDRMDKEVSATLRDQAWEQYQADSAKE